jgi:hypothetical protein
MKKNFSTEKNFGLIFSLLFFIIGIYFFKINFYISIVLIIVSSFFLVAAIYFNKVLIVPNLIWYKIGVLLSKITTPVIMAVLYFLVVTPTALLYFFLQKKQYITKIDKKKTSYWIERNEPLESMNEQY